MITNDYKDKLLQNLTKMTTIPISNYGSFTDVVSYEKEDIISELDTTFPYGYVQVGELQCKNSDNEPNGFSIVYGYYYTESGQTGYGYRKGYMIIFDDNMNKVSLLTQYDSGTDFAPFVLLNVDEKGQIYGVDFTLRDGNYKNRFIMLNNISVKQPTQNYKAVLRQSYFIQSSDDVAFENLHMLNYICKDPNSSHYAMGRTVYGILELKINVGSENEWTYYKDEPNTFPSAVKPVTHPLITWNEEGEMSFTTYYLGDTNNTGDYGIFKATNEGTTIKTSTELYRLDTLYNNYGYDEFMANLGSTAFTSYRTFSIYTIAEDEAYIMLGGTYYYNSVLKATYDVWKIYNNNLISNEFTTNLEADERTIPMFCDLELLNGNIFVKYYWQPHMNGGDNNYLVEIYAICSSPITSKKTIAEVEPSQINKFHVFGIRNAFELYTIYWLGQDFDSSLMMLSKTNLIYGEEHYNGTPGMNVYSLVPTQIRLYDNEGIIFARTLYNMTINNNIIESSVQVPNTMLNDTTIIGEKLMGYDMTEISTNDEEITKNIYETLYVNIFNKINMVNKNNPDNPISNIVGASRIANSVSTRLEEDNNDTYDNARINKVRINYKNGDSYIKNIISCNITNNISDIQFQLTPINDILNIEIISNDEKTIYQRIVEVDNYEIGKTYKISQKCHVE